MSEAFESPLTPAPSASSGPSFTDVAGLALDFADLEWWAFRYITGELSHVEQTAFESRLSWDQQAREAVASLVMFTQTVAAAEAVAPPVSRLATPVPSAVAPHAAPPPAFAWRASAARWVAAACVLSLVSASFWAGSPPAAPAGISRVSELVELWASAGSDSDDDDWLLAGAGPSHEPHPAEGLPSDDDWIHAAVEAGAVGDRPADTQEN